MSCVRYLDATHAVTPLHLFRRVLKTKWVPRTELTSHVIFRFKIQSGPPLCERYEINKNVSSNTISDPFLFQECVGLIQGFDVPKAELSREPALQRAPQAFYATFGFGRIRLDHLHTQALHDSSKLGQADLLTLKLFLDVESIFLLWMYKEDAAVARVA